METGYDILFFWVARMMMLGLFLTDVEPFHTVYLHGLVRAQGGVKMSKTKGNVTDPVELIDEIGADAVRLALTVGTSAGSDQRLTMAKLDRSRNFANKLWNAARFVLSRPAGDASPESSAEPASLAERWIRSRLSATTAEATRRLDRYDLGGYAGVVTDFAWGDLCDWYLEMAKVELRDPAASPAAVDHVVRTGAEILAGTLRLLHPIMPFVTEEIWGALAAAHPEAAQGLLMTTAWPEAPRRDRAAESEFDALAEVVRAARNLRTEAGIAAGATVPLRIAPGGRGRWAGRGVGPALPRAPGPRLGRGRRRTGESGAGCRAARPPRLVGSGSQRRPPSPTAGRRAWPSWRRSATA